MTAIYKKKNEQLKNLTLFYFHIAYFRPMLFSMHAVPRLNRFVIYLYTQLFSAESDST